MLICHISGKHRAFWRELYTVEEAEHLIGLVNAAKESNIDFYYSLSPGLDITYSSEKEVSALKRKLEQVTQFGCSAGKFKSFLSIIDLTTNVSYNSCFAFR